MEIRKVCTAAAVSCFICLTWKVRKRRERKKWEIKFLFDFKVLFHVMVNSNVFLWGSAFSSDIPSYLHYYGMHSFSMFVLTSKDESLPTRPCEILWGKFGTTHILCSAYWKLGHMFKPILCVSIWMEGTSALWSKEINFHCRGHHTSKIICLGCCFSSWFNSAVAPTTGQLTFVADF